MQFLLVTVLANCSWNYDGGRKKELRSFLRGPSSVSSTPFDSVAEFPSTSKFVPKGGALSRRIFVVYVGIERFDVDSDSIRERSFEEAVFKLNLNDFFHEKED